MSSFSSDQSVAHATADAQMVPTTQRARVTSIQAEGVASASVILKSGGAGRGRVFKKTGQPRKFKIKPKIIFKHIKNYLVI